MQDRNVHLGDVIAVLLWVATLALLGYGCCVASIYIALGGCAMSAAAATATIRNYFCTQTRIIRNSVEVVMREREGERAPVRPLR